MNETYELIEASGHDGEIYYAEIAIHFEQNGETITNHSAGFLSASIEADSDHDLIIQSALNSLGARQMNEIRKDAHKKLSAAKDTNITYFSAKQNKLERCFIRLALLELNEWDKFKKYFDHNSEVTSVQRAMFEDAPVWKKSNTAIRRALGDDDDLIDRVFTRAFELSKKSNRTDVFDD